MRKNKGNHDELLPTEERYLIARLRTHRVPILEIARMGDTDVVAFLTHLAVNRGVAASTQNQALNALVFLYRHVLNRPLGDISAAVRAKRPVRLPSVLTRQEVKLVLGRLLGTHQLAGSLLYGSGLRLMECLRLRVKDVDYPENGSGNISFRLPGSAPTQDRAGEDGITST